MFSAPESIVFVWRKHCFVLDEALRPPVGGFFCWLKCKDFDNVLYENG